jgi:DNA repair protein RadD
MLALRDYQQSAIQALYSWLGSNAGNPLIVAPTGSGKSLLIAKMVQDVTAEVGRVLVLAHVKELLKQNADEIAGLCPGTDIGIYSAGLKRKDTNSQVIVAGIASVYRRAGELDRFDLIIVDEAHMISPDEDTMYGRFIADARTVNPNVRIVGLTATPYRMDCGPLWGEDKLFCAVAYEIKIAELVAKGFLCPVTSKASKNEIDTSKVSLTAGDFDVDEIDDMVNTDEAVRDIVAEIVDRTQTRKSVLIFANSIKHAEHIVAEFRQSHGYEAGLVIGDTPSLERDALRERFVNQDLKYLVNVGVYTTGFNAKCVDCIALVRATMSLSLYVQMVGRGLRIFLGKANCLLLDFGQNIKRHGPIDDVKIPTNGDDEAEGAAPVKVCPECQEACHAAVRECPDCGFEFPPPVKPVTKAASKAAAMAAERAALVADLPVKDIRYSLHKKKGADDNAPYTMRVDYQVGLMGLWRSEWVCFEHDGYSRTKAENWWRQRSDDPCPRTVERALEVIESGGIAVTETIKVKETEGKSFPEIIGCTVGVKPEAVPADSYAVVLELANKRREMVSYLAPQNTDSANHSGVVIADSNAADIPF